MRRLLEDTASEVGGWLKMSGASLRLCVSDHHPDLKKTATVKNLRAIVHSRYSLAKGLPANAEIDLTTLKGLPHEVKSEIAQLKAQQRKTEGKLARQRKNHQKSRAGRAAFL